jgi:hypothetical protein
MRNLKVMEKEVLILILGLSIILMIVAATIYFRSGLFA